jgi:hypothetical protein
MATKLEPWPYRQGDTDKPTPAEALRRPPLPPPLYDAQMTPV